MKFSRLTSLLTAASVSSLGDGVLAAALPLFAAATINPTAVSVVAAATAVPWVLVGPFAGVLVDSLPRRTLLVVVDLVRAFVLLAFWVIILRGEVSVLILCVIAFVMTAGQTFSDAGSQTMVVAVVGKDRSTLQTMNGRLHALESIMGNLLGPALGGFAYGVNAVLPVLVDAISFAGSAGLIRLLPQGKPERELVVSRIWLDLREGIVFLIRNRRLSALCLFNASFNFCYYIPFAVLVLFSKARLGLEATGFGLLLSAVAVGGIAGGLIAQRTIRRVGERAGVVGCLILQTVCWPAMVAFDSWLAWGILLSVLGFAGAIFTIIVVSARQLESPDWILGRVVTAFRILGQGALPLGAVVGGWLASTYDLSTPFLVGGALSGVLAVTAAGAKSLVPQS